MLILGIDLWLATWHILFNLLGHRTDQTLQNRELVMKGRDLVAESDTRISIEAQRAVDLALDDDSFGRGSDSLGRGSFQQKTSCLCEEE